LRKPPQVSARKLLAALRRAGFVVCRQSGSHAFLRHPVTGHTTIVPMHTGSLKPEFVSGILKQAGIGDDEFLDLLG